MDDEISFKAHISDDLLWRYAGIFLKFYIYTEHPRLLFQCSVDVLRLAQKYLFHHFVFQ